MQTTLTPSLALAPPAPTEPPTPAPQSRVEDLPVAAAVAKPKKARKPKKPSQKTPQSTRDVPVEIPGDHADAPAAGQDAGRLQWGNYPEPLKYLRSRLPTVLAMEVQGSDKADDIKAYVNDTAEHVVSNFKLSDFTAGDVRKVWLIILTHYGANLSCA